MNIPPRHHLYRSYLKHLRHIPDPHIWKVQVPYFRSLLDRPSDSNDYVSECSHSFRHQVIDKEEQGGWIEGETSRAGALRESRRLRGLQRARKVRYRSPSSLTNFLVVHEGAGL